jgi:hypothetical protein
MHDRRQWVDVCIPWEVPPALSLAAPGQLGLPRPVSASDEVITGNRDVHNLACVT